MTRHPGRRRGFTLIELMVVVSSVGILATLATPKVVEAMRRAKAAAILSDLNTIRGAALASFQQTSTYPVTGDWGVVPPELVAHLPQAMAAATAFRSSSAAMARSIAGSCGGRCPAALAR